MLRFISRSVIEFDTKEELEGIIATMPWSAEEKSAFFKNGIHHENEEVELDKKRKVKHEFRLEG